MALRNAFENIATEATQAAIAGALGSKATLAEQQAQSALLAAIRDLPVFDPIVGTITSATSVVLVPVSGAGSAVLGVAGTFGGVNVTFEGSPNGGANWYGILGVRSNSNTADLATGSISAAPAHMWRFNLTGLTHIRHRATTWTSGTATLTTRLSREGIETNPFIQTHAVTGSGNFSVTPAYPTGFTVVSAATTNATVVSGASRSLHEISISNPTAAAVVVKLYNKVTVPAVGTDVPLLAIPVAAGQFVSTSYGFTGKRFSTGLALAITGAMATADTSAAAAGVLVSGSYL